MTFEVPKSNNNELFKGDNWVLPTDIGLISKASDAFLGKLIDAGWDQDSDEVYSLHLAFDEALINAIAHGNLGIIKPENSEESLGQLAKKEQISHPTNKKVYINIEIDKNKVFIKIRDEGNGFDWKNISDSALSSGLLKTKGRGMFFMKVSFDTITYNEKGNEVTMIKEKKK